MMTPVKKGKGSKSGPKDDGLERMAIRLRPGYSKWLAKTAAWMQTDKSKLMRQALIYYVETHQHEFPPELVRELHELRRTYKDSGVL